MLTNAQWPELEDFYGYLAGVHIEAENGRIQARVYLPVKVPNARGGIDVKARAVGPTFYGRTGREVFELAERWAIDYLKGAYGVYFRVRRLAVPEFGPTDFVGLQIWGEAAA